MATKLLLSVLLCLLILQPNPAVTAHEFDFEKIEKDRAKIAKKKAKMDEKAKKEQEKAKEKEEKANDEGKEEQYREQANRDEEKRLREWAEYLHRLEHHLDDREDYLRDNFCPSPPQSPANLCEFCVPGSKCSNGLTCRDRRCQRVTGPNPITCPDDESCGPGQKRHCTKIKDEDFQAPGVLQDKLINTGFFVGKTDFIPDCVMGKVRINCARREQICTGGVFCITMTLKECRQDGLFKGDLSGRDTDECCVKAVPVDCFVSKLCRCVANRSS